MFHLIYKNLVKEKQQAEKSLAKNVGQQIVRTLYDEWYNIFQKNCKEHMQKVEDVHFRKGIKMCSVLGA